MNHFRLLFKRDIQKLEYDPDTQYRFNAWWAVFWLIQMPAVLIMIWLFPREWKLIAFVYLTEASLWANFANHFGAMSSALAAKHASEPPTRQQLMEKIVERDITVPETPQTPEAIAQEIDAGLLE